MKNKYIHSIFVAFLSLAITSCSDFLEEDAKGILTPDNFFKNEAEANLAINGLHANASGIGTVSALGTDIAVSGRDPIAPGFVAYNYAYDDTNPTVVAQWGTAFANIKDANFAIAAINASSLSEDIKQKAIAEAYFYRALSYFNQTLLYGDIPYWRDELDIDKVALLGTTSAAIIQQDMINDLNVAISSGKMSTLPWKSNTGRPSVWAARMLKANICMWLKQWSEAKAELLAITTSPSPYATSGSLTSALSSDYARMYREGNELDSEIIYGKQNLANIINNTTHATFHFQTAAENANTRTAMSQTGVWTSSAAITIRKSFANTYPVGDKRKKYNVWENHTLTNGTIATFNFIYIPKMMRSKLPISDPLMINADPIGISSAPNRVFVLSDAYLLLAEAEFMINGSSTLALEAINKIRSVARTGLAPYTSITLKDIQNERGWELTVEGFFGRKRDLIRWGILESTATSTAAAETSAGAYALSKTRAIDEAAILNGSPIGKYQIFPIPSADILRSQNIGGALKQNPLWE